MGVRSVLLPKTIFVAAMQLAEGDEREAFIREACYDDQELRCRIDRLVAASKSESVNPLDVALKQIHPDVTAFASPGALARSNDCDGTIDLSTHPSIGPYKLLEVLGQGGMGAVYLAEQSYPIQRTVALKVVRPGMDSREVIARFAAERQALAMMDHPNIARVLDAGTTERMRPYFVMELVRGVPINQYCLTHQLSLQERLRLFVDVCHAVQHAHQKGIIHRDLKPSNILVVSHDGKPVPKVIDFGVAKALNQESTERTLFTRFPQMIGTPLYMSPEQSDIGGIDVDTRTDIYSLGVVLYEILTGSTPFERAMFQNTSFEGIRRMIREDEPVKPSVRVATLGHESREVLCNSYAMEIRRLQNSLQGELDWIVMTALAKCRDERYETANALADDVQRFLDGEPVIACPPSLSYRLRKVVARHWIGLSVASMILLAVLMGGGLAVSQAIRATVAEQEAKLREEEALHLLEAARLQQILAAFRDRNFSQIADIELPMTDRESGTEQPQYFQSGSLRKLLKNVGTPLPDLQLAHPGGVNDFNVTNNKQYLVSACADGAAYLWDLSNGKQLQRFGPHQASIDAVAASPDGRLVASGCQNGNVWVWDAGTGQRIKLLASFPTGIETIVWSNDGNYLAAGGRYSEVRVWNADFEQVLHFPNDHRHESLLFSLDNKQIYIPTRTSLSLWDLESATQLKSIATDPLTNIRTLCWAGSNHEFILAGDRFTEQLVVIDVAAGKPFGTLRTHVRYPQHLAVNPDRTQLATVFEDGHLRLFDLKSLQNGTSEPQLENVQIEQFKAHNGQVGRASHVHYLCGDRIVTSGLDGMVQIWSIGNSDSQTVFKSQERLRGLAALANDELFFFSEESNYIHRYDTHGNDLGSVGPPFGHPVNFVGNSSAQNWVPVRFKTTLQVRSLPSGDLLGEIPVQSDSIVGAAISKNGNRMAVSISDGQIVVFQTDDRWKTCHPIGSFEAAPRFGIRFADNDETVIADHQGDYVIEWSLSGQEQRNRYTEFGHYDFELSSDSRLIAAGTDAGFQVVERFRENEPLLQEFISRTTCFLFCDQNRILLTGHHDGRIRAWHLSTGEGLGVLFQPDRNMGMPMQMQFFPDKDRIVVHYDSITDFRVPSTVVVLGAQHVSLLSTYSHPSRVLTGSKN